MSFIDFKGLDFPNLQKSAKISLGELTNCYDSITSFYNKIQLKPKDQKKH